MYQQCMDPFVFVNSCAMRRNADCYATLTFPKISRTVAVAVTEFGAVSMIVVPQPIPFMNGTATAESVGAMAPPQKGGPLAS